MFINFLQSLCQSDPLLIESVMRGYNVLFENKLKKQYPDKYMDSIDPKKIVEKYKDKNLDDYFIRFSETWKDSKKQHVNKVGVNISKSWNNPRGVYAFWLKDFIEDAHTDVFSHNAEAFILKRNNVGTQILNIIDLSEIQYSEYIDKLEEYVINSNNHDINNHSQFINLIKKDRSYGYRLISLIIELSRTQSTRKPDIYQTHLIRNVLGITFIGDKEGGIIDRHNEGGDDYFISDRQLAQVVFLDPRAYSVVEKFKFITEQTTVKKHQKLNTVGLLDIIKKNPINLKHIPIEHRMKLVNEFPDLIRTIIKKGILPEILMLFSFDDIIKIMTKYPDVYVELFIGDPEGIRESNPHWGRTELFDYINKNGNIMDIINIYPKHFDKVINATPDIIGSMSKNNYINIVNKYPKAFAKWFTEAGNSMLNSFARILNDFSPEETMIIFNAIPNEFVEIFKHDIEFIKRFPEEKRINVFNRMPEVFTRAFVNDIYKLDLFPENDRMDILNRFPESFKKGKYGFEEYPILRSFPKNQRMDILKRFSESFEKGFTKNAGAIEYFPEDEKMNIFNKFMKSFAQGLEYNPYDLDYFPEDQHDYIKSVITKLETRN